MSGHHPDTPDNMIPVVTAVVVDAPYPIDRATPAGAISGEIQWNFALHVRGPVTLPFRAILAPPEPTT